MGCVYKSLSLSIYIYIHKHSFNGQAALYSFQGVLARYNAKHARASDSSIDIDVYCPPEFLEGSGPLFGDTESAQSVLDEFLSAKVCDHKIADKCVTCGYPCCECNACLSLNKAKANDSGTRPQEPHSCALKYCSFGKPPAGGHYSGEMLPHFRDAWAQQGVLDTPVYVRSRKGYFWPEEM